ncbi:uncharacterized protein [Coffea arabica]|uniref:F-box/LRR-repeat protein 4-like n=1 Tax=Coffea arabica TaxID=13443 RepID=A0A6P6TXV5_COFAR|nr:F-box/LRR-repeat protein 4-like [Coffea arabica]XP_027083134.1 F-box/LRR-repeat protein 4-like [Coffea arabica]
MDRLGEDELASILEWIQDPRDRNSFSLVCKRWCNVEGLNKFSLRVFEPNYLLSFLPRFPNLLMFESSEPISDAQMEFLARTCPSIQKLNLYYHEAFHTWASARHSDFGHVGLCALAKGCCNLRSVVLRRRRGVSNAGVSSLVKFSRNLVNLDVRWCKGISDEALEAIGTMSALTSLNLQGCCLISDEGLASLAKGSLCKSLEFLNLAECDRISDDGVMKLVAMKSLEVLKLAECGPKVTDVGGRAVAAIESLKRLNLSWLINVSDDTVFALAQNSKNLATLHLEGCELVTGDGIRAFTSHKSLRKLELCGIYKFNVNDVEELVLGCQSLEFIGMDQRLRSWIPVTEQGNIFRPDCRISWRL